MGSEVSISFRELREFQDRLKRVDLPKIVLDAQRDLARLITRDAIPRIPVLKGDARGSIVITESGRGVDIQAGVGVPYYGWLDFGGSVGPNKSIKRPYLRQGRYLWKSFANNRQRIMDDLENALKTGFETKGIKVDD